MMHVVPPHAHIMRELQAWFTERTGIDVNPEAQYPEDGDLDSFDVMEFVVFLEDHFGIRFESEDFSSPTFLTLQGLAEIIRVRLAMRDTAPQQ